MDDSRMIPDQSSLRVWLRGQLAELTEHAASEVPYDQDFHELGLDSVGYLNLGISIEESFGAPITAKEIFLHSSVEKLSLFLIEEGPNLQSRMKRLTKGSADYTTANGEGDLAALFWLNGYELLEVSAPYLPSERPVYYLHHQGSDGKVARYRSIETMASYYIDTILHIEPEGPYCIGGYSVGANLAYEIAQQLKALGKTVDVLLLLSPAGHPQKLKEIFLEYHQNLCSTENLLRRTLYMARKHLGRYGRMGTNKVRRLRDRIRCYRYFLMRKNLPSRLIWTHVQPIYALAIKHYEVSDYLGDTIIAHESTNSVEEWRERIGGRCHVVPAVPINHLELLSAEYSHLWIEEFLAPLGVGGWEHEEGKQEEQSSVAKSDAGQIMKEGVAAR